MAARLVHRIYFDYVHPAWACWNDLNPANRLLQLGPAGGWVVQVVETGATANPVQAQLCADAAARHGGIYLGCHTDPPTPEGT